MTPDEAAARLEAIGKRIREADAQRAAAMQDLVELAPAAREAGLPIRQIAMLGGVTRPTIYKLLEE